MSSDPQLGLFIRQMTSSLGKLAERVRHLERMGKSGLPGTSLDINPGTSLQISEEDGVPSVGSVVSIIVSNDTLTDLGSGTVQIDTGGGGLGEGLPVIAGADVDVITTLTDFTVARKGTGILLFSNVGAIAQEFEATAGGLTAALAAAFDEYILELPACVIPGDHTLISSVHIIGRARFASTLTGSLSSYPGASIERLSISIDASSADELVGIDGPSSGELHISDVHVNVRNSGAGDAYGVRINNGDIEAWATSLNGVALTADGYGGYLDGVGSLRHILGRATGSTAPYYEGV